MPKGPKLEGILLSAKPPAVRTLLKFESKTSIVPARKFVAKRKAPRGLKPMASPLYTALLAGLVTAITACVGSTSAFHPAIVPFSVANNSVAGADLPPAEITKPFVPLVATPVGAPGPPPGAGTVTTRGNPDGMGFPSPS